MVAAALVALAAAGLVLAGGSDDLGRAAAAVPPEPADLARRRPAGRGRHRPVLGRAARAVLRAWERTDDGGWRLHTGPVRARVGYNGFVRADKRRQGTGTSPAGTSRWSRASATGPTPGRRCPTGRSTATTGGPTTRATRSTYNVLQPRRVPSARWRTSLGRGPLRATASQYRYVAVLDFNLPGGVHRRRRAAGRRPAGRHPGSAAASSCTSAGPGATAGLRLDTAQDDAPGAALAGPGAAPVLVMGPRSAIARL